MYIPVGLIVRLAGAAHHQMQEARMAEAEARMDLERAWADHDALTREVYAACTGPAGCLVYLGDGDWTDLSLDGARIDATSKPPAAAAAGYRNAASIVGPGPHGFYAVSPGRHSLRATVGPRRVAKSFVVYPGEAFLLRLDRAALAWASLDPSDEKAILDRALEGELALFSYHETVAGPWVQSGRALGAQATLERVAAQLGGVLQAILARDTARATQLVEQASAQLDGAPLPSLAPITTFVGFNVFDLAGKGKAEEAWTLLQAGLALLPDDVTLLALLGETQLRAGNVAEGRAQLTRALAREAGLDDTWKTRARALLAG
jgi:hypothetical protein